MAPFSKVMLSELRAHAFHALDAARHEARELPARENVRARVAAPDVHELAGGRRDPVPWRAGCGTGAPLAGIYAFSRSER